MSLAEIQTQTQESESQSLVPRPITPEIISKLIEQAKEIEWKYLLKLRVERRFSGCGYRYLFDEKLKVIYGDAKILVLNEYEENCTETKEVLVIPMSVPTVVVFQHFDDDPTVGDYMDIYIFTDTGWKVVRSAMGYLETEDVE
jgi:hypothetical protein